MNETQTNQDVRILFQHRELARILRIIHDSDEQRCKTRELLHKLGSQTYGHSILLSAEKRGLVKREQVKPEGKGNWIVYNYLTKRGKRIAKLAKQFEV